MCNVCVGESKRSVNHLTGGAYIPKTRVHKNLKMLLSFREWLGKRAVEFSDIFRCQNTLSSNYYAKSKHKATKRGYYEKRMKINVEVCTRQTLELNKNMNKKKRR